MSWSELAPIAAIFVLGGFVKGIAGFGLPAISLGLLSLFRPPTEAIAIILLPVVATNAWQAFAGGALRAVLRRLWPFLVAAGLGAWVGAGQLGAADRRLLNGLLGAMLAASAALALFGPRWPQPSPRAERWLSPPIGFLSGVSAGLTGSFLVPAAPWLVALRLSADAFVQGFGLSAVVATATLGLSMTSQALLSPSLALISAGSLAPAFLGLWLGRQYRSRLPEATFRTLIQGMLLVLGLYIVGRAALS